MKSKSASSIYNLADLAQIVKTRTASIGIPSALLYDGEGSYEEFHDQSEKEKRMSLRKRMQREKQIL